MEAGSSFCCPSDWVIFSHWWGLSKLPLFQRVWRFSGREGLVQRVRGQDTFSNLRETCCVRVAPFSFTQKWTDMLKYVDEAWQLRRQHIAAILIWNIGVFTHVQVNGLRKASDHVVWLNSKRNDLPSDVYVRSPDISFSLFRPILLNKMYLYRGFLGQPIGRTSGQWLGHNVRSLPASVLVFANRMTWYLPRMRSFQGISRKKLLTRTDCRILLSTWGEKTENKQLKWWSLDVARNEMKIISLSFFENRKATKNLDIEERRRSVSGKRLWLHTSGAHTKPPFSCYRLLSHSTPHSSPSPGPPRFVWPELFLDFRLRAALAFSQTFPSSACWTFRFNIC